jgi:hypothetical protein
MDNKRNIHIGLLLLKEITFVPSNKNKLFDNLKNVISDLNITEMMEILKLLEKKKYIKLNRLNGLYQRVEINKDFYKHPEIAKYIFHELENNVSIQKDIVNNIKNKFDIDSNKILTTLKELAKHQQIIEKCNLSDYYYELI